jgi:hypothetical protein
MLALISGQFGIVFDHDLSDAHTAEDKSAKSNGVNKSAKVMALPDPADLRCINSGCGETGQHAAFLLRSGSCPMHP